MKRDIKFKNKNINLKYLFFGYVIFAVIFILIVALSSGEVDYSVSNLFDKNSTKYYDELEELLSNQEEAVKKLKKAAISDSYTLDDPYILVNPFDVNPLSAVIIFTTNESTSVSVAINDVNVGTTEESVTHIIPVYGLYSNIKNSVLLTLTDGSSKDLLITTEEVNSNHEEISYEFSDSNNFILRKIADENGITSIKGFNSSDSIKYMINGFDNISSFNVNGNGLTLFIDNVYVTLDELGLITNISINNDSYIGGDIVEFKPYVNGINDYSYDNFNDSTKYSSLNKLELDEVSDILVNSELYEGTFDINYLGEYLSFDIDSEGSLILVRSDGKIYTTDVIDSKVIKISNDYEYSLYYKIGDNYFNLYSIVKNG